MVVKSKKIKESLAAKVLRCHRARERGKRAYAQSDRLLDELLLELGPGEVVKIDDREARIVDKLREKNQVAHVTFFRRYELKID